MHDLGVIRLTGEGARDRKWLWTNSDTNRIAKPSHVPREGAKKGPLARVCHVLR